MAQKRTIDIDINTNADQAAKEFDNLGKATDRAAKSVDNLDATFEEVYGELQPLTTRMGEAEDRLYELALAGDTTSKEYQELLTKVGQYRKVQIQTDLAVDQAAQTMSQKLGTALTGATSGFAAVQGVMALTGGESKALEESLLKVQGAMAFQQGVQGVIDYSKSVGLASKATRLWSIAVGGTTGAMKLLRLALISTGIGALVVVLGTLIANQDKVSKGTESVTKSFEEMPFVLKLLLHQLNSVVEAYKTVMKAAEFLGLAETKQEKQAKARHREKMKRYLDEQNALSQQREDILHTLRVRQKALDDEIEMLEAQGKKTTDLQRQKLLNEIEVSKQIAEVQRQSLALAIQNDSFLIGAQQNLYNFRLAAIKENERKLAVFDAKINTEKLNNYREYADNRLQIARQIEDLENQLMQEGLEKQLEINRDHFRREREDITAQGAEKIRLIELFNQLEQKEEDRINNEFRQKRLDDFTSEIETLELFEDAKTEVALKGVEERIALTDEEKANNLAVQQAKVQFANDSLSAISDLVNAFAGESEKSQRKAFEINKAIGITQAVINTAGAISAAINPAVGGLGIPAGLPGAALAAATGAAQIATIANSQFQGGGGGETPSVDASGGVAAQAPSFNVVGDSGINQLAQLQQAPVQAFVVSGEVTTSQALDRNRVENATL